MLPLATSSVDIKQTRECLGESGKDIKILAKIDNIHGIENFEDIINEADGVVFNRNELGWEIPSEKLMIA